MTRVVKIGGRVQSDAALIAALATAAATGEPLCVVHGGGDEISALQRRLGLEPVFNRGRRVTSAEELEVVRMVLSGTANKRLVAALLSAGVPAVGLSGEDGALIGATRLEDGALGFVGVPARVDAGPLRALLASGYVPVVSPVARALDAVPGGPPALNVNGDDAAAALAGALGADELLLVADVEGVMIDGRCTAQLDAADIEQLIAGGVASGGMEPKLRASLAALARGVHRVRIGGAAMITDRNAGTSIEPARSVA